MQPDRQAQPVLKWAGGKRALLEQYAPHFPAEFGAYHEPFVGGAAVFFHLRSGLGSRPVVLSDVNRELINCYLVLRDDLHGLVGQLAEHQQRHGPDYFYAMRRQHPSELTPLARAARLIYLNRTCYNGLYRVNSQGYFNVPIGRYANPTILDEERLRAASRALAGVNLRCEAFEHVLERAHPGDLVYFDPPYHPVSSTANFTSYTQDSFSERDQQRLADTFTELHRRGVRVMLSNSDTRLIRMLYAGFRMVRIRAPRFINSKASGRKAVGELLILGESAARKSAQRELAASGRK